MASSSSTTESSTTRMTGVAGANDLIARCHAIAEDLNGRGALDLAVPFYRQTIALLLAQAQQAEAATADPAAVAEVLTVSQGREAAPTPPDAADLDPHLQALEQDLTVANATTVQALLQELQGQHDQPSAQLLGLLAKTHLLQAKLEAALACFHQALELAPADPNLLVNTGAARLACGDCSGALSLLRPLAAQRHTLEDPRLLKALLRNLALAELEAGRVAQAALLRAELAGLAPDELPLEDWLEDVRQWLETGCRQEAKSLLVALRAVHPRQPAVLELLAHTYEALGDFRDAALVYRDLLRPRLMVS
jgi:tetratricopeptide (TPR) repeat protein